MPRTPSQLRAQAAAVKNLTEVSAPATVEYTPTATQQAFITSTSFLNVICGARGDGKCFQIDTPVLTYSGAVVPIQSVGIGDLLMGPDGMPRTVLGIHEGIDDLWTVLPVKGEPFTVTTDHLVTVKRTTRRNWKRGKLFHDRLHGEIIDVPLYELRQKSATWFNRHRLFHVPVDFPEVPVALDPYFLGIWLADGTATLPAITTPDPEIVQYIEKMAVLYDCNVRVYNDPRSKASDYHLTRGNIGGVPNPVTDLLRHYNLIQNKHIPHVYKANSRFVRLELLAGLLDGDGWTNRSGYEITQKSPVLAQDIAFLARSLGFQSSVTPLTAHIKSLGFSGTYYRIAINGNGSEIPVKIPRKRVPPRSPNNPDWKNVLHDGIASIEYAGRAPYYGCVLDGDQRFLLGDFTVTHNTVAGLFSAIYHAIQPHNRARWPLNWALVRDTRRNIGITTARTIQEWFQPPHIHLRGKPDEPEVITLSIGGEPALTFDCFGIDSSSDLSRFQSYEASGGVWIEEPAPAATNAETLSSGIAEVVLAMAITSCRGSLSPRIQLTMNPPPADHWTAQLWRFPGFDEAGDFELEMSTDQQNARAALRDLSSVFFIRPGENVALDEKTPGYREKNRLALLAFGRRDLYARLVEGRVGYAKIGEAVTPWFNASHLAPTTHLARQPLYIAYDFGLMPAAVIAQISPQGLLLVHAAYGLENQGIDQLISRLIRPYLLSHPDLSASHIVHIGGPEGRMREQSNSEITAVKHIIQELGGRYIAGPVSWSARRDALAEALTKSASAALPWVRIHPVDAAPLVRALDGAWHYPVDAAGRIARDLPAKKGLPPSFGDAFAHLCAVLLRRSPRSTSLSPAPYPPDYDPEGSGYIERPRPLPTSAFYARFGHARLNPPAAGSSRTGV